MWAWGHASIPPAPGKHLRAPHGSPAKGKGLLFLGETEARAGWVGRTTAHSRSPKGTRTGTQESGVPCAALPALPPCCSRELGALTYAWARSCTHASVSTHATCCAHSHAHTCAPPALCPATTHGDKPRTCHLHGHCPLPCPQGATCQPLKHTHCTVPPGLPPSAHHTPKLHTSPAGSMLRQGALVGGELSSGGCMSGAVYSPSPPHHEPPHCLWCERGKREQKQRQHFPHTIPTS